MSPTHELKYTSLDSIPGLVGNLRSSFDAQKTKSLDFRLVQLRKLYWAIIDNQDALLQACQNDLGKSTFETFLSEIDWCTNDIVFVGKNLSKWMKDENAPDIPLPFWPLRPKIRKDPLGCVLVIGPYNFPIQLALGPLIGAIAAGNTAVLKPSEQATAVAVVLQRIIETALDPTCYGVVQGGVPETTALLDQKWDKILYTGSATVGTIIAKKAAETLTPVTLELGGRNPAIVTKNANAGLAARRLLWGKVLNAGQVCISQNYTLIEKEIFPLFVEEMKRAMHEFYPNGAQASPDYGRIINHRQWARLKKMLDGTKGQILFGGATDEASRFIEPTLIQISDLSDPLIAEESFGPIIPLVQVDTLSEAIAIANKIHSTPLGAYPFGTKQETNRVLAELRSGGASVNDAFFHGSIPTLAFGGVGDSGQGNYRGRASFDCFTHRRSVTTTPGWMERLIAVRYPPYHGKLKEYRRMSKLKPNFDREGRVKGWGFLVGRLAALGAYTWTAALTRYAVITLVTYTLLRYRNDGTFRW